MRVFPFRVAMGVGVAVAVLLLSPSRIGNAQPGSGASAPASAGTRDAAKKLVQQGISAQDAQDYSSAIAFYLKAFSLNPHPLLLFNVAQAYRLAGCPERAVSFYERYLTLEPKGTQAAVARAAIADMKRASKPDEAHCVNAPMVDGPAAGAANPTGRLKLRSAPDGATVMLDGVKIGRTPLEREVDAGAHSIVLVDDGMLVGERSVEIKAGAVVEVTIPIERRRVAPPADRPSRLVPALFWAGGGLTLAGSGVAFYLGQQGGPDHPEDRWRYRGATTTGYVLVGAGVASVGAGIWLWVRGSRESAPVAAVGPGGSYLGWQGRF